MEEYRAATISEAVTGRIDVRTGHPYPAYKPSGIEWLGDIPSHWEVRRLKGILKNITAKPPPHRDSSLHLALENVESWTGRLVGTDENASFDSQSKQFAAGDILFGKLRPYLAKVTRPNVEGVCVGEFLVLRPEEALGHAPFLEHLLRSAPFIGHANSSTYGARMPRTNWEMIGGTRIPLPTSSEQSAVAEYLDRVISKIDTAIANTRREIELLEEYRTRMIADVVTGQVDVREASALIEAKQEAAQ